MLPLSLLRTAQNHPMLVELKNGETYNGHLVSCDNWMNINLREVICTSRDGDKFWRMPECYIRGSTIKYLRIPDEVIDMVKEETQVCFAFSLYCYPYRTAAALIIFIILDFLLNLINISYDFVQYCTLTAFYKC